MKIACMTTCKDRVDKYFDKVQEAIDSIAKQVDRVYLTISEQEFGTQLPAFRNCLMFRMVKDLRSFKKYMPLKRFYHGDDIIFFCDDDWKYHDGYADYMLKILGDKDIASLGNGGAIGAFTVMKGSAMEPDFFDLMTDEVIETRIDDIYLTKYMRWKKRKCVFCNQCVDDLVRTIADPLIPESVNNPNNEIYPKTFKIATKFRFPGEKMINQKIEGFEEAVNHIKYAIRYGLHCNDLTFGEIEDEICFALDLIASKNNLPEIDWEEE
jgi:hypothetical protein